MTIISAYSIKPSLASSDVADENDARKRREAKRKLVNEPPLMRQAERKVSEKLLSDALQLASKKAQRHSILELDTRSSAKGALEFIHAELDSGHPGTVRSDLESPITNNKEIKEQPAKAIAVLDHAEEKPLQLAGCLKKLIDIESSLVGSYRRADSSEVLEKLKNFNFQLINPELIAVSPLININDIDAFDHDFDSMNCCIDFIEGYCEASSFSDDMKKNISSELNTVKSLLSSINELVLPSTLSSGAIDAVTMQIATENIKNSSGSKHVFNENSLSAVRRKVDKNREDTLPLATLRSI